MPGASRPCVRRRASRRTQLVGAPSPALHLSCIPSLHLSRCSRPPPLGPLLLLERPSPWNYRPPPAEAATGPAAIFVARQPLMHATDAVVGGQSRVVAAGACGHAQRLRRGRGDRERRGLYKYVGVALLENFCNEVRRYGRMERIDHVQC